MYISLLIITIASLKLSLACHDSEYLISENEHSDGRKFHFRDTVHNQYLMVEPDTMILSMASSSDFENAKRY